MPTYEFRCPEGHDFEKMYRTISSAESAAACPVCGKVSERVMSATGFAFKGSGFYLTDYGKNAHRGEAPAAKSDAPAGSADGGSSEKSPDKSSAGDGGASGAAPKADAKPAAEPKAAPKAETKPAAPPKSTSSE